MEEDTPFKIAEISLKRVKVAPEHQKSVFENNTVSRAISECAIRYIHQNNSKKTLGLGCGNGTMENAYPFFGVEYSAGSDIDEVSVDYAKKNAELNGVADKTDFRCGDMYEPFRGTRFQIGIHDASSVAQPVAALTPWYPEGKYSGGDEGIETSKKAIECIDDLLEKDGVFILGRVSLANEREIAALAKAKHGSRVIDIQDKYFPKRILFNECLYDPKELEKGRKVPHPVIRELKRKGTIFYEEIRGRLFWYLHMQIITART